jgi:hypothetical protein
MNKREWPAWRWSPDGVGKVFQSERDVPEGWMTKLEYDALPKPVADPSPEAPEAARLRASLLKCPDDILDEIAGEPTALDAASAAIDRLVSRLDLSGDGKAEDNRDEIKKALKAKNIPFDGRASTPALKALLEEGQ